MPRNQGTSRKGKPKKLERAVGMGRALERAQHKSYRPKANGASRGMGGMIMTPGVTNVGIEEDEDNLMKTNKSMLDVDDLTDFMTRAQLAQRVFASEHLQQVVVDAKGTAVTPQQQQTGDAKTVKWVDDPPTSDPQFTFTDLAVPRRPPWDASTTPEQLDRLEQESFLEWRRNIALREEHEFNHASKTTGPRVVTPFEKNLQVWRQLWRVVERCQVLVQILDARNPLFYLNQDLRQYATVESKKPMLLLLNKSDYLTTPQRRQWHAYLTEHGWDHVFFSAHDEQEKLDQQAVLERKRIQEEDDEAPYQTKGFLDDQPEYDSDSDDDEDDEDDDESEGEDVDETQEESREDNEEEPQQKISTSHATGEPLSDEQDMAAIEGHGVEKMLTREQLMLYLKQFAQRHGCKVDDDEHVPIGMVGFPNVGKSSVINVLVGASKHLHGMVRVGVAAQPGKTKHFQTLFLPDRNDMMLCDCPGLVFPSFVSNTADLIAAGVYPISQMRDFWPVVELICQRIPRAVLEAQYAIQLPVNPDLKQGEAIPPPTAEELLTTYCVTRAMLAASSGAPDYQRASRIVIKDYAVGKLLYCHIPPVLTDPKEVAAFQTETLLNALHRTKKLREKLLQQAKAQNLESKVDGKYDDGEKSAMEDLEDILEFVKVSHASGTNATKDKKSAKKPKTTKRGRQGRQDDPYGCTTSPDDLLDETVKKSSGLIVNAGKYGRAGYTRPTSYAGARSATVAAPKPALK